MNDPREYRMLADWYEDIADLWLRFGHELRLRVGETVSSREPDRTERWLEMTRQCMLRAGRYARLAEKAKAQHQADLTNVTPIKNPQSTAS